MAESRSLGVEGMAQLQALLSNVPEIQRLGVEGREPEWQTLGHALADIHHSCLAMTERLIPALLSAGPTTAMDALQDIAEELRHIRYHAEDSLYLRVFRPPTSDN